MNTFKKIDTFIEGLFIIEPSVYEDERGFFMEFYNKKSFKDLGLDMDFVQDNHSLLRKGVLRGLHFQINKPQGKLVSVVKGEIFDVAVDLRKTSTYKKWHGVILSSKNKKQFYIPEGFAHGFLVLSDEAEIHYKCSNYYDRNDEGGIIWNDPELSINWPINDIKEIILSNKDKEGSWNGINF